MLCDELQKQSERITKGEPREYDLLINCPPSVSKSSLVSITWISWIWGFLNPHFIGIFLSHSETLSDSLSTQCKDLIESSWYKELCPHIRIRQDSTAKSHFKLEGYSGERISGSVLGGYTGSHGMAVCVDDAHQASSISDAKLQNVIDVYHNAIPSRLTDPLCGIRINIGQRVAENDLSGNLLSKNSDGAYKHYCLPMELSDDVSPKELRKYYEANDGVLWKSRFPRQTFKGLANSEFTWATQYMQSPKPVNGNIIRKEWLEETFDWAPVLDYHIFLDAAETANKDNDPSAILIGGIKDGIIFIKHVEQQWMEFPDVLKRIQELHKLHCNSSSKIYVEGKSSGKAIIQTLKRETLLNVVEMKLFNESKLKRLNAITPVLESKRVKLMRAGWNDQFIAQCIMFPASKHDDMLDVLIYCVDRMINESNKLNFYFSY